VGKNLSIHGRAIALLVALEGARESGDIVGVTNGRKQRVFFNFLPLFARYMNYPAISEVTFPPDGLSTF